MRTDLDLSSLSDAELDRLAAECMEIPPAEWARWQCSTRIADAIAFAEWWISQGDNNRWWKMANGPNGSFVELYRLHHGPTRVSTSGKLSWQLTLAVLLAEQARQKGKT